MTEKARLRRQAFTELEQHPRFAPFLTRRGRRQLVSAHALWGALGYAAIGVIASSPAGRLSNTSGTGVALSIGVATLLLWLFGFVLLTGYLNASVNGITELPYAVLDEAQQAVRARAEADAHRATRVALFLVGLWAVGSLGSSFATRSTASDETARVALVYVSADVRIWAFVLIAAGASLLALLPLYLLGWRLTDSDDIEN